MSTRTTPAPPAPVKTVAGAAGPAGAPSPVVPGRPARRGRMLLLALATLLALGALAVVHLSQGTAAVDLHTLWQLLTGAASDRTADEQSAAVVLDSRLPRLAAGLLVGCALGAAGAALQSVSRNMLASPTPSPSTRGRISRSSPSPRSASRCPRSRRAVRRSSAGSSRRGSSSVCRGRGPVRSGWCWRAPRSPSPCPG